MIEDNDSKQQELPPWKSEDPTPAGPAGPSVDNQRPSSAQSQSGMVHPFKIVKANKDGCCSKFIAKCGPIGWYLSPMFDKLGYSLLTTLYHIIMFAFTLAVFIIIVTLFSVSVGLLVLVFGFILFWWTCEISVVLARIDLALSYYMVEDNEELISNKSFLKLSLYKRLTPCPCSTRSRIDGGSFCGRLFSRMKSVACQCDMWKIYLHQMLFKPLIVGLTWWICIVVIYNIACVFAPIVYIVSSKVFTKHYWCPFGNESCDNGECSCEYLEINNFGSSLLFGLCAFILLPLTFRISIWFAKASKVISYFFISNYYSDDIDAERSNLLSKDSMAQNNNNITQNTAIVHSINNPYTNDV